MNEELNSGSSHTMVALAKSLPCFYPDMDRILWQIENQESQIWNLVE